ncbi:MAG: hypothetical protein XXXJIFNMEKO3_01170 [Candidatus Erwinia impunctatus]|nr:hypothetical protein XXXJIFNMEKO_01170 [Culicoides impunctatus]
MREKYLYSKSRDSFYPFQLADVYRKEGVLPNDTILVSSGVYEEFSRTPMFGEKRGVNGRGELCWLDSFSESN